MFRSPGWWVYIAGMKTNYDFFNNFNYFNHYGIQNIWKIELNSFIPNTASDSLERSSLSILVLFLEPTPSVIVTTFTASPFCICLFRVPPHPRTSSSGCEAITSILFCIFLLKHFAPTIEEENLSHSSYQYKHHVAVDIHRIQNCEI